MNTAETLPASVRAFAIALRATLAPAADDGYAVA
jgi:hypothetical protein